MQCFVGSSGRENLMFFFSTKKAQDACREVVTCARGIILELNIESVFSGWYWLVFLGIYHTNTEGNLGWYILVSFFWREPLFPSKRGHWPPFRGKKGALAPFLIQPAPLLWKKRVPAKLVIPTKIPTAHTPPRVYTTYALSAYLCKHGTSFARATCTLQVGWTAQLTWRNHRLPSPTRKHSLCVGWRNFFSSCDVVSVFGSGEK